MKIISWNIARRKECWERLLDLGADLALLQEAAESAGRRGYSYPQVYYSAHQL